MSKAKQPYIPLYIGDWEQDVNTISLEAEGALLKLTFKLWKSPEKGRMICSPFACSLLLKKSENDAKTIINELKNSGVLDIKTLENGDFLFESRRMLKEVKLSETRAKTGSLGAEVKKEKAKRKQKTSKPLAKDKQSTEYDIEYDNENKDEEEEKGSVRGKEGNNIEKRMHKKFLSLPESENYIWDASADSTALLGLKMKISQLLQKKKGRFSMVQDKEIFDFWCVLLDNLPKWYRSDGFSLKIFNQKFNELIKSIQSTNNDKRNTSPTDDELAEVIARRHTQQA